jgi:hypothetical protein
MLQVGRCATMSPRPLAERATDGDGNADVAA